MRSLKACLSVIGMIFLLRNIFLFVNFHVIFNNHPAGDPSPTAGRLAVTPLNSNMTPPAQLQIDFYGGSITVGQDFEDYKKKRFSALVGEQLGVFAVNRGIPGAGPRPNLICGITPTDIIISEFRINERSANVLNQWYDLACQNAKHVVILDLWSWLTPPAIPGKNNETATIKSFLERQRNSLFPDTCNSTSFSILSLAEQDESNWQCLVPSLFNYTVPNKLTGAFIPKECYKPFYNKHCEKEKVQNYSSRHGRRNLRPQVMCRQNFRERQHGQPPYHEHVANQLIRHIKEVVFPTMHNSTNSEPKEVLSLPVSTCIGEWGEVGGNWDTSILENFGFQISSPFSGRVDKTTLNTNIVSSSVLLGCPVNHSLIQIGYVAHSWKNETVTMSVETGTPSNASKTVNTRLLLGKVPFALRLLRYTESFSAPVNVTLLNKMPNAWRLS
eukprot:scaffold1542_cov251-Chaetoceros_neogracile.AAC.13